MSSKNHTLGMASAEERREQLPGVAQGRPNSRVSSMLVELEQPDRTDSLTAEGEVEILRLF